MYCIWLNVNGEWKAVVLDDYIPCINGLSGPIFSNNHSNELWVILLEKAYAKTYGNYIAIEGGDPGHALRDLTGAPYEYMEDWTNLDTEKLWNFIY